VHGVDEAMRAAADAPEIMVIGGADLFRLFLPRAGRIHLTRVHGDIAGDVRWPPLDDSWSLVSSEPHDADPRHAYAMTFEVWEKGT
jgi:dihydrofolate reductase